ncbi:MAG: hypothetical protein EPN94_10965 [Nitrospirae bacterium]|nr:MAG: hypothetical protein EPN94_10965 [Nitrospirota bacterium]
MSKGTRYEFVGLLKDGKRVMAKKGCSLCYGRGYTGVDRKHKLLIPCKCIMTTEFAINWIILGG